MGRIKKFASKENLSFYKTFIVDNNPNSDYFRITEFKDTFTGGKNGFLIAGSEFLKESTEIKIEILDVNGNAVYYEPGHSIPNYYEGVSKLIAVYIYDDTPIGLGKITILGELKTYKDGAATRDIPVEWRGIYNVKWEKTFQINKNLPNEDRVRFYRKPTVVIDELVKPIFNKTPQIVSQSGNVDGIPLVPIENTSLNTFSLPTSYRLKVKSGNNWTGSVLNQPVSFTSLGYFPVVTDVVSDTEVVVSPPYAENGIVKSFLNQPYSVTFPYQEGAVSSPTSLAGSFAKINITNLKTFVGDVARVKIYRRSQSQISDYEFIQDIQLESNEILKDVNTTGSIEETYGILTQDRLSNYWSGSSGLSTEFNQTYLYNSVKLNSLSAKEYFYTKNTLDIQLDIEYSLSFNVRKESSSPSTDYLRAFISGSVNNISYEQTVTTVYSTNSILQKVQVDENFIAYSISGSKLYFELSGDGWYLSDISLKAAQETAFSPDEITFIQSVPKTLPTETFDYRFEFYDINNNYIPALVETTKTFTGGNLTPFTKDLNLTPNRLYFSFDSSSSSPIPPLTISVGIEKNVLTGSVTFTSGAYDRLGNLLSSSLYAGGKYPGLLTNIQPTSVKLTVSDFTGSRNDIDVQYIEYVGECEGLTDSFVITRLQDGQPGRTGAGVTYRGVWKSGITYNGNSSIKDVVKSATNGNYYVATQDHISTISDSPPGGVNYANYWDGFGATFASVATDVLFSQDVYANRTINVGTGDAGNPVIALNAGYPTYATPYISIGQTEQSYDKTGVFLGYISGSTNAHLSLVSTITGSSIARNKLNWNGSNLIIEGEIVGGGLRLGSTLEGAAIYVPAENSPSFSVDTSGNLIAESATIRGTVIATDGTIGDWIIDANTNALRDTNSEIVLDPNTPEIQLFDANGSKRVRLSPTGGLSNPNIQSVTIPNVKTNVTASSVTSATTSTNIVYSAYANSTLSDMFAISQSASYPVVFSVPSIAVSAPTSSITYSTTYPNYLPAGIYAIHGAISAERASRGVELYGTFYYEDDSQANTYSILRRFLLASVTAYSPYEINDYYYAGLVSEESVTGDTLIYLADGTTKEMQYLDGNDLIIAWDMESESFVPTRISAKSQRIVDKYYAVTAGGHTVNVSDTHGFWQEGGFQIYALDLIENESEIYVKSSTGIVKAVVSSVEEISCADSDPPVYVYTVSVPKYQNYVSNQLLSHNASSLDWVYAGPSTIVPAQSGSFLSKIVTHTVRFDGTDVFTGDGYSPNYKFAYSMRHFASSGKSTNTAANGSTTISYVTASANSSHVTISSPGLDTSLVVDMSSNITEITSKGIQVLSGVNQYVKIERFDTIGSSSLLEVKGGNITVENILPSLDDFYDLGSSAFRWDDVYATNGTIQTSDINSKDNISESDLGIEFINDLVPVSFNFKNGNRTHYGLIAQDVERVIQQHGKQSTHFAGLITGSLYGLRYHEFISPMIKAIQELHEKVERLESIISGSKN